MFSKMGMSCFFVLIINFLAKMSASLNILCMSLLLVMIGCKPENAVRVVKVPKVEKEPVASLPPVAGAIGKTLENDIQPPKMEAPEGWTPQPLDAVRKGSWKIAQADTGEMVDISVTVFPGDVGGLLANVNRWRGQLSLKPWDEMLLNKNLQDILIDGLNASFVALLEEGEKGTLGAILPREGYSWFFKMTGPVAAVAQEEARFRQFLTTIHF